MATMRHRGLLIILFCYGFEPAESIKIRSSYAKSYNKSLSKVRRVMSSKKSSSSSSSSADNNFIPRSLAPTMPISVPTTLPSTSQEPSLSQNPSVAAVTSPSNTVSPGGSSENPSIAPSTLPSKTPTVVPVAGTSTTDAPSISPGGSSENPSIAPSTLPSKTPTVVPAAGTTTALDSAPASSVAASAVSEEQSDLVLTPLKPVGGEQEGSPEGNSLSSFIPSDAPSLIPSVVFRPNTKSQRPSNVPLSVLTQSLPKIKKNEGTVYFIGIGVKEEDLT